jgi:hypothetical protein
VVSNIEAQSTARFIVAIAEKHLNINSKEEFQAESGQVETRDWAAVIKRKGGNVKLLENSAVARQWGVAQRVATQNWQENKGLDVE